MTGGQVPRVGGSRWRRRPRPSPVDLARIAAGLLSDDGTVDFGQFTDNDIEDMADRLFDRMAYGDSLERLAQLVLEEWT